MPHHVSLSYSRAFCRGAYTPLTRDLQQPTRALNLPLGSRHSGLLDNLSAPALGIGSNLPLQY
ncbi:hypothetical protein GOP47_0021030 [Adiantum capillus-veneris]|uniref:Uncharacterized protein n=1 Tax=Adiantum capillus-veneris TaxID=13818 RepID=A0A9D4Z814_ADICA|nr:hypothetical protein GOP47_0021030 [Adiantum capillus-veneris]